MRSAYASRHQLRVLSRRCLGLEATSSSELRPRWTTARSYALPAFAAKEEHDPDFDEPARNFAPSAGATGSGDGQPRGPALQIKANVPESSSTSVPLVEPSFQATEMSSIRKPKPRRLSPKLQRQQSSMLLAQALRNQQVAPSVPLSQLEGNLNEVFPLGPSIAELAAGEATKDEIQGVEQEPTLENLMRYRPSEKHKPSLFHPTYAKRYAAASRRLGLAFVKKQLYKLCNQLLEANALEKQMRETEFDTASASKGSGAVPSIASGLIRERTSVSHKASKEKLLQCIMDAWGWPHPDVIEKDRKKRELEQAVSEESIKLSNAEAFLISRDEQLWRDLSGIRDLQISVQRDPVVTIKASGTAAGLGEWRTAISDRRANLVSEDISLAALGGVRPELLQTISEVSGAFLEGLSDVAIRISYVGAQARDKALQMLSEAHYHLVELPTRVKSAVITIPSTSSIIAAPTQLALYPFMPVAQRVDSSALNALNWWLAGRNAFRLRRASGWSKRLSWSSAQSLDDGELVNLDGTVSSVPTSFSEMVADMGNNDSGAEHAVHWEVERGQVVHASAPSHAARGAVPVRPALSGSIELSGLGDRLQESGLCAVFLSSPARLPVLPDLSTPAHSPVVYRKLTYRLPPDESGRGQGETLYAFTADPAAATPGSLDNQPEAEFTIRGSTFNRQQAHVMLPDSSDDIMLTRERVLSTEAVEIPKDVRDVFASRDVTLAPPSHIQILDTSSHPLTATLLSDLTISEVSISRGRGVTDMWRRTRSTMGVSDAEADLQHTICCYEAVDPGTLSELCLPRQ